MRASSGVPLAPFGSASAWHAEGQGFDPPYLHQNFPHSLKRLCGFLFSFSLEFGLVAQP